MKVKVKMIARPYKNVSIKSLQAILRSHTHGNLMRISTKQLFEIMEELTCRREKSGKPFRSNDEAWVEFIACYMPRKP